MAQNFESAFVLYQFQLGFLNQMLIGDVAEDLRAKQPFSGDYQLKNHPAWQIGHMTVASDGILKLLDKQSAIDESFREQFGRGSKPTDAIGDYPTLAELAQKLAESHDRAVSAIASTDDDLFAAPNPNKNFVLMLPAIKDMVLFMMTTHESIHMGQMTMWRKAMGLPNLVG